MATKDFSSVQESMIAEYLGWSVVAGSGAAACFPGDVISDDWLGECKTHVERGAKIFFSKSVWNKIKDEASVKRRYPVLFTDDGSQKADRTWCLFGVNRLDLESFHLFPILPGVKVNISISHQVLNDLYKENSVKCIGSDKICALTVNWSGEEIAILPLEAFAELLRR